MALRVLSVAWLHAMVLALAVRAFSVALPAATARPIRFAAQAVATLIVPPLLAWGTSALLGLDGLVRAVLILEASTPTAVNALILSLQYKRRPDLTASIILITTIGGVATTTLLLWLLA